MMRWRLLVAEAAVMLVVAKLLVALLRIKHWRWLLGPTVPTSSPGPPPSPDQQKLARAVLRADARLPVGCKCLQRAIALHWMLHLRRQPSQLVVAVLDSQHRGTLDDLHAWVEISGSILIGAPDKPHHAIVRFGPRIRYW